MTDDKVKAALERIWKRMKSYANKAGMAGDGLMENDADFQILQAHLTPADTGKALEVPDRPNITNEDECDKYFVWALMHYDTIRAALQPKAVDLDHCDLMRDEFMRIKACPDATEEIKQLCDRAIKRTNRNIPVLEELENLSVLKQQQKAGYILYNNEGFSSNAYEIVEKVESNTQPQPVVADKKAPDYP